jgi:dihydroorotate dehydrogenase (fumarate)
VNDDGLIADALEDLRGAPDLTTSYLGFALRSPLVASAGPSTAEPASLRALGAAGVGAVVLPSLFEEQIVGESLAVHDALEGSAWSHPEAPGGYLPDLVEYNTGPTRYLQLIEGARKAVDVPVIASLNGTTAGGWTGYARMIAEAGAHALELNVYRVAADADISGRRIEDELVELIAAVRDAVGIPLAVKLGPYYSSLAHLAPRLVDAGADGLVLFNRFYQPDIDLETLDVTPHLVLSSSDELRLPLRWIAILRGRIGASLAATSGVHTWRDVAKVLLAGADVAMMTSALLRNGPDHLVEVENGLLRWMLEREYVSIEQLKGSVSQRAVADPAAFERANYIRTLTRYSSTFRP